MQSPEDWLKIFKTVLLVDDPESAVGGLLLVLPIKPPMRALVINVPSLPFLARVTRPL